MFPHTPVWRTTAWAGRFASAIAGFKYRRHRAGSRRPPEVAAGAITVGMGMTVVGGLIAAQRNSRRRDREGERWLWLWQSPVGGWLTRLAGLGLGRRHAEMSTASGRNERAIVNTVERMFRELPQEAQRALADLPEELWRIEVRTIGLRTWMKELEAHSDGETWDDELIEVSGRLRETVLGLEGVRLQLEALLEGVGTVEGVTRELEAAREIGEAVDGVLEGREERGR